MRCALVVLGACGLVVAPAAAASAHSQEIGTSPATRVVARLPLAVSVTFDKPLRGSGYTLQIIGRDGADYGAGPATVYRATTLRRDLQVGSPNGPYTVTWAVVSGDGHPETGSFGFIAAHGNGPVSPTGAPSQTARAATPSASASAASASAAPAASAPAASASAAPFLPSSPAALGPAPAPPQDSGLRGALGSPEADTEDEAGSRSLFTYLPLGLGAVLVIAAGLVSLVTRRRSAAAEAERDRSPLTR